MTFSERSDLLDRVDKLKHRVHVLNMLADYMVRRDRDMGNAFGVLSEDMQGDLDVLMDGLEALEVAS